MTRDAARSGTAIAGNERLMALPSCLLPDKSATVPGDGRSGATNHEDPSMRATTGPVLALLGVLCTAAVPARAQEPKPVRVCSPGLSDRGGLLLGAECRR
jgi:hypothetical protein